MNRTLFTFILTINTLHFFVGPLNLLVLGNKDLEVTVSDEHLTDTEVRIEDKPAMENSHAADNSQLGHLPPATIIPAYVFQERDSSSSLSKPQQSSPNEQTQSATRAAIDGQESRQTSTYSATVPCARCGSAGHPNIRPPIYEEDNMERRRRVEIFKNQILQKLQLTRPPNITTPLPNLPKEVLRLDRDNNHRRHHGSNVPDNAASTSKIFLVADEDDHECDKPETSNCFRFPVSPVPEEQRLASAQLWVYLNPIVSNITTKRTLLATLPALYYNNRRHTLATKDVYIRDGWVELPLRHAIKRFETSQHYIEITCKPSSPTGSTIATKGSLRPILTMTYVVKNRKRRGSNGETACDPSEECCLESLQIIFEDIDWTWIIRPPVFTANYCTGVCHSVSHDPMGQYDYPSNHSRILSSLNHPTTSIPACCAPSLMSSLDIIYRKNDDTVGLDTLTDMIADECACIVP